MEKINPRLLSWASLLEPDTQAQAVTTASMPFVFPHVALMPDAHLGKGATVGSVIPTLRAVMPAAVGVDLGCGMIAVRTQLQAADVEGRSLEPLRLAIEQAVPLSAGGRNLTLTATAAARVAELEQDAGFDPDARSEHWRLQLGTLGSGNHFIEVSLDSEEQVWLFLHSGSRGVGNRIATQYVAVARAAMERWWIELPDPDLAYLVEGTEEFEGYLTELGWAQRYALANREEMMDRLVGCLAEFAGGEVTEQERINCHHNFTQVERHWGREVWVSRKGAIEAKQGQPGLIPGSMGTASYVVAGRGNPVALNSAPHGAGRRFSRSAARRRFDLGQLRVAMAGIEFRDSVDFLDEIPAAYKDIDQVMADAADLVEVRAVLRQIVNVKGS